MKKKIKAYAIVSKKSGLIKYLSHHWYNPTIKVHKKHVEIDVGHGEKMIPVIITYEV